MHLWSRQSSDCKPGSAYYVCQSSGFRGCCSVDACYGGGCPDLPNPQASTTITVSLQPTTTASSGPSAITASTVTPSSSSTSARSTMAARTSSIESSPSPVRSSPTETNVSESSSLATTPIIAGSVSGAVALILIAILVWLCLRRKRNEKLSGGNSTANFSERKEPYVPETSGDEEQQLRPNDPFAPFGGYQRSPSRQARRASGNMTSSEPSLNLGPGIRQFHHDRDDAPLPDIEKSSIAAPPLIDHPALHLRPGESPAVPVYRPERIIISPELAQHPALLAKHHSLPHSEVDSKRLSRSRTPFPFRRSGSMRRVAVDGGVDSLPSLPSQRRNRNVDIKHTLQRRSYIPLHPGEQDMIDAPRKTRACSLPTSHPALTSLIPGRSELPAVVPQELSTTSAQKEFISQRTKYLKGPEYSEKPLKQRRPVGLGASPFSPQYNPSLQPLTESSPPQTHSHPRASTTPYQIEADIGLQIHTKLQSNSPRNQGYQPSPRSAQSPNLSSPYYQNYVVSPDIPSSNEFMAFGHKFNSTPHISQLQTGSPNRIYRPASITPSHTSSPKCQPPSPSKPRTRSLTPPQPLRLDTSDNIHVMPIASPPLALSNRRSRSPILRSQALMPNKKASLGKGRGHATAWTKFDDAGSASNRSSNGSSLLNCYTEQDVPVQREEGKGANELFLPSSLSLQTRKEEIEEEESPVLPRNSFPFIMPRSQTTSSFKDSYPEHPSPRWSGSTAAGLNTVPSSPTETISPAHTDDTMAISPSCYSQDCSTMKSQFSTADRGVVEVEVEVRRGEEKRPNSIVQTPLEMMYSHAWVEREDWSALSSPIDEDKVKQVGLA